MVVYNRPLSASSIKTLMECEAKFVRQYILKIPRSTNDALKFGRAIHEALEYIEVLLKKEDRDYDEEVDFELCRTAFYDSAAKEGLANASLLEEGEEVLKKYLSSRDSRDKVVDLEKRFKLVTDYGIPITGAIDKIVEVSEDTCVVVDYKTSFYTATPSELEKDVQLSMYDLAVRQLYPQYKNIILMLDYLRKKPVVTQRDDAQRGRFEKFLVSVQKRIKELEAERAREQINTFCTYCDYRNICTVYNKVFGRGNTFPELTITENFTAEDCIDALDIVKSNQKILKEKDRELRLWITSHMKETGRKVETKERYVEVIQQSRVSYDTPVVYNTIPTEEFLKMAVVNKTSLDRFLAVNPSYRGAIERAAKITYSDFYPQIKDK
jgi:RecB family exonuclease